MLREGSEKVQGRFREGSEKVQGRFREVSGKFQGRVSALLSIMGSNEKKMPP